MHQQEKLNRQLSDAAEAGDVERIRRLVTDGANVNNTDGKNGWTPLHHAASAGHLSVVQCLMEEGVDPNIEDVSHNTPLILAITYDHLNIVKYLIDEKEVDPKIHHNHAITYLEAAALSGRLNIIKYLVEEKGADPNAKSCNGASFSFLAIFSPITIENCSSIFKFLIEEGLNVNQVDKDGRTLLSYFVVVGNRMNYFIPIINHVAKLEAACLYVNEENLRRKGEFINTSDNRRSNYWEHLENYKGEVKKIEKESQKLHSFLKESNINELISVWERNADIQNQIDNHDNLKEQYPEYAHILINKANGVKKEIFLHNHKPLIDALSTHYKCDIKTMTFAGIKNFFKVVHRDDFKEELGNGGITLINFVDFEDITTRYAPTLKVKTFVEMVKNKDINSNLERPSTEQTQGASQSLN